MNYILTDTETKRLKFSLLTDIYFDEWVELFRVENVAKFLGIDVSLSPEKMCELWFEKSYARYENKLGGMNVLTDKETGNFIGQCGLLVQEVEETNCLEIGYSILPKYWNQGYASEAAIKCKEIAFERNYTNELISIVHPENLGSELVAHKNGMILDKKLDDYKGMPVNIFKVMKG